MPDVEIWYGTYSWVNGELRPSFEITPTDDTAITGWVWRIVYPGRFNSAEPWQSAVSYDDVLLQSGIEV